MVSEDAGQKWGGRVRGGTQAACPSRPDLTTVAFFNPQAPGGAGPTTPARAPRSGGQAAFLQLLILGQKASLPSVLVLMARSGVIKAQLSFTPARKVIFQKRRTVCFFLGFWVACWPRPGLWGPTGQLSSRIGQVPQPSRPLLQPAPQQLFTDPI